MSKSDLPTSSKDSLDGNELDPERVRFTKLYAFFDLYSHIILFLRCIFVFFF